MDKVSCRGAQRILLIRLTEVCRQLDRYRDTGRDTKNH
jgi:hypothetical protein